MLRVILSLASMITRNLTKKKKQQQGKEPVPPPLKP